MGNPNAEGESAPQTWQDSPEPVNPGAPTSGDTNPEVPYDENDRGSPDPVDPSAPTSGDTNPPMTPDEQRNSQF